MNWVPMMPVRNPTSVLASPPMPSTPLDSASCASPAAVPASRPVTGPEVSATDTTTTSTRSTAHGGAGDEPAERGLQDDRRHDRQDHPGSLHSALPSVGRVAGVSTTSTSSSARKSTAGLTTMRLYDGPFFSTASTLPITKPFG